MRVRASLTSIKLERKKRRVYDDIMMNTCFHIISELCYLLPFQHVTFNV